MAGILIFLLLCSVLNLTEAEKTFIASFQTSGEWSENEWIEYNRTIPSLAEFTACHWEKVQYFSAQINTVWSYCVYATKDDLKLRCVEVYYLTSSDVGGNIDFNVFIDGWTDKRLYARFKKVSYYHRSWNHFCWTYSIKTGIHKLYHNGQWVGTVSMINEHQLSGSLIRGSSSVYDSAFIIGQEPDSMRGDFSKAQAFPGEIAELNIWDRLIGENDIFEIAKCMNTYKGNAVTWKKSLLTMGSVKIIDIDDSSIFCKDEVLYVMFPQKVSLKYGGRICSKFGGKVSVPYSEKENNEIASMVSQHSNRCIDNKNYGSLEKVKGIWLGLQYYKGVWYDNTNFPINSSKINYTNWYGVYNLNKTRDTKFCPYMFSDGKWGYERKISCDSLSLCLICSFRTIPLYTLKGQCKKSTSIEWNYYMSTNDSNQVDSFEGLKKKANISLTDGKWKKLGKIKTTKMDINNTHYPLGRYDWEWYDESCGVSNVRKKRHTFSVCKFGKEYTCDSGECVEMEKRCDTIYDCKDASDEDECRLVNFPDTYRKWLAPFMSNEKNRSTSIITNVQIEKIDFIDTSKMRIGLTIVIQMKWKDKRLTYQNIHHKNTYTLSEEIGQRLWLPLDHVIHQHAIVRKVYPDTKKQIVVERMENEVYMDPHSSREDFVFAGKSNNLKITQRFRTEYNCLFELQNYPFDNQACEIGLKLDSSDHEQFYIVGHPNESVTYADTKSIQDFEIVDIKNNFNTYLVDGKYRSSVKKGLVITILIKRSHVDQTFSIFCPSILLGLN